MHGLEVKDAGAPELIAVPASIQVAGELVAAADRDEHGLVFDRLPQGSALDLGQVVGDEALLAVLSAAHKQEVVGCRVELFAQTQVNDFEVDASQAAATLKANDIAPV